MPTYNHDAVERDREHSDCTWEELASAYGAPSGNALRKAHARWRKRSQGEDADPPVQSPAVEDAGAPSVTATLTREDIARITSLEDLLAFFKVDTEAWEVSHYKVNKWEQASGNGEDVTITPLYQVKANLIPRIDRKIEQGRQVILDLIRDAEQHAPTYDPVPRRSSLGDGNPVLFTVALMDPHFGMRAYGAELTGIDQDLDIAAEDYAAAIDHLLPFAHLYNTERILFLVGNDMLHVDAPGIDGRIGGATTKGTPQDVDTRLGKMFTVARRAIVSAIDKARMIAPVDVRVVPGNHDRHTMYKMSEVLHAWYRNDSEVDVPVVPGTKQFYAYGKNTLLLTHGEEVLRKRDHLAMVFADECPPDLWVTSDHRSGGYREILTGHLHKKLRGGWYPTGDLDESRGIRLRGMSGLTATDSWHYENGYRHQRAATVLAYRRSGGVQGEHEFTL